MATKQETAEIKESLERINASLGNLAELITGQKTLFENLANQVETNRLDLQRQIDTLRRRIDTAFEMITETVSLARSAHDLSKEANEVSREFAGNVNLSRDLAVHSREMLALAQQQLNDMRLELAAFRGDGAVLAGNGHE